MTRWTILAALLISVPLSANAASSQRTDQLMWECTGKTAGEVGMMACAKFIDGMMDMHSLMIARSGSPMFCLPKTGISIDQAMRIFVAWANNHPKELHNTARVSVAISLHDAFPCQ
jgi:hypothetical protein